MKIFFASLKLFALKIHSEEWEEREKAGSEQLIVISKVASVLISTDAAAVAVHSL
jgi:hypothetical protein